MTIEELKNQIEATGATFYDVFVGTDEDIIELLNTSYDNFKVSQALAESYGDSNSKDILGLSFSETSTKIYITK